MAQPGKPIRYFRHLFILAAVFAAGLYAGWRMWNGSPATVSLAPPPPPPSASGVGCPGEKLEPAVRMTLKAGMPTYSFQLFYATSTTEGQDRAIGCIEAVSASSSVQVLSGFYAEPLFGKNPAEALSTQDANFDGYEDLRLVSATGATGNVSYNYWLFDPRRGEFVFHEDLSNLTSPTVHPASRQIRSYANLGCAGECFEDATYVFEGGTLVPIKIITQDADSEQQSFLRITKERRNGVMEIVDTKTIPWDTLEQ